MSTNLDTAQARLRAADPTDPVESHDASARAMFERIVADPSEPPRVRTRSPRRRLVLAGAAVVAVAAVATAGVTTTPWSHGHPVSAAYALDRRSDGSIDLVVWWNLLRDPAPLNRELARLGAHTVFIPRSDTCHVEFPFDAAHPPFFKVGPNRKDLDPTAFRKWAADLDSRLGFGVRDANSANLTIHPGNIPAGDTMLIPYQFQPTQSESTDPPVTAGVMLVPHVPPCVPTWAHTDFTDTTVRSR